MEILFGTISNFVFQSGTYTKGKFKTTISTSQYLVKIWQFKTALLVIVRS